MFYAIVYATGIPSCKSYSDTGSANTTKGYP